MLTEGPHTPCCQLLSSNNNGWTKWNQLRVQRQTQSSSNLPFWNPSLSNSLSPNTLISLQKSWGNRGSTRTRVGGGLMTPEDECVLTTAGSFSSSFFSFNILKRVLADGVKRTAPARADDRIWTKAGTMGIRPLTRRFRMRWTTVKKKPRWLDLHRGQSSIKQIPHSLYTPPAFQFVLDWYTCTHHSLWLMPHPNHNKNQRRGSMNASLTSPVQKAA